MVSIPKILVLDPSASIREVLSDILTQIGYETTECDNELTALASLNSLTHNIAIVAFNLPTSTAIEFMSKMKADGHLLPTIIVSSPQGKDMKEECIRHGATDFFVKPFNIDDIVRAASDLIKLS